jgi:metal-responsive CopG/Arc/MetJ family transcriptional regulator
MEAIHCSPYERLQVMGAPRRITISLPEDVVRAADQIAAREGRSRSDLIRDALEWHLHVQNLPVEEPTPEERAALAAGRAQHARGEFVSIDEIRRELAADLLAKRPKKPAKATA